jgi:hypothetical protein
MDETVGGYWDVLWGYLYMAVYFGPLAVQAGFRAGCDVCREAPPNIPRGDEAAGRPHAWVGGSVIPVTEGPWAPAGRKCRWRSPR